jgi:hypothetical protein
VSSNFYKKDANFHQNPKVQDAGFWGAVVYDALLALNRQHRCDGHIRPSLCRPEYLARYVGLAGTQSWISRPAAEVMRDGLIAAQRAKLITMSQLGVKIVGWGPEWADGSSTERTRRWREAHKGTSQPSRDAGDRRGEERRGEDPIPRDQAGAGAPRLPTSGPFTEATRELAERIASESGLDEALSGTIDLGGPAGAPSSPPAPGKRRKSRTRPPAPAEALQAALLLLGYVADNQPGGKVARLNDAERVQRAEQWADAIRLLHEQDGLPYVAIEAMVHWCQKHEFWRTVILSGSNLREKWDTMAAQRGRGEKPAKPGAQTTGPAAPTAHDEHPDGDVQL